MSTTPEPVSTSRTEDGPTKAVMNGHPSADGSWVVPASDESRRCINPIRSCEELYFSDVVKKAREREPHPEFIKLSIGDPAVFGNLPPHSAVREAVSVALETEKYEGYGHSCGLQVARQAVAEHYTTPEAPVTYQDVILTSSISGALEMSLVVLSNPGQNVLLPRPGFAVYHCHSQARGLEPRFYNLLPDKSWEVDLNDLEQKIDDQTAAIYVNNPSNPCGCVYSRKHLEDIVAIAERHKVPIISDETYAWMVFEGEEFHSLASITHNVPMLTCTGISKRFFVPGWRVGWIIIHDKHGALKKEVIPGLGRLAMKILGPCTLIQAALPDILSRVPDSWHRQNMDFFETNARKCFAELSSAPGLKPIMPAGTMYMMVVIDLAHFPEFSDDVAFTRQMVEEQSVFCLPGMAFNYVSCFRVVLVMPLDKIADGCGRIKQFCVAHYRP